MTGKVIVNEDEWTLASKGFSGTTESTERFVANIAKYFAGEGKTGNFLGCSENFGLNNSNLKAAFTKAGHVYTMTSPNAASLANFKKYDGVFVGGQAVSCQILIDYVKSGGNVYVCGGSGALGTSALEARTWNPFLKVFGFEFKEQFNGSNGVLKINGTHQILEGISGLFFGNGNEVMDITPNNDANQIFTTTYGGAIGVFDDAPPPPAEVKIRITRSGIEKSGSPAPYTISIGNVSKDIHFCRIGTSYECTLETPGGVTTPVRLEATGRDEPYNGSLIACVEVFRNGEWVKIGPENVWCEGTTPPKDEELYLGYDHSAVQVFSD